MTSRLKKFSILALLSLFVVTKSDGQKTYQYRDFEIAHYTNEQGLPSTDIKAMSQDSKGFLWLSTVKHLVRFDGYEFKTYLINQEGGLANEMLVDSQDQIWIASLNRGVYLFKPQTEEIVNFQHDPQNTNSLRDNAVHQLTEDSFGNIWAGTWTGLHRLHFPNPQLRNSKSVVIGIWFAEKYPAEARNYVENLKQNKTLLASLSQVENNQKLTQTFELMDSAQVLIYSKGERAVLSNSWADFGWLSDAGGNKIWEMVPLKTKNTGGYTNFREQIGVVDLPAGTYTLHFETNSRNAFGSWPTQGHHPDDPDHWGILAFSVNTKELEKIQSLLMLPPEPYISGNIVTDLFVSNSGHLWVTGVHGLDRISFDDNGAVEKIAHFGGPHTSPDNRELTYQNIQVIEEANGSLSLVGNRFDQKPWNFLTQFSIQTGKFGPTIDIDRDNAFFIERFSSALTDSLHNTWFGTRKGLFFKDNNHPTSDDIFPFLPQEFNDFPVRELWLDDNSSIWLSTRKGLYRIKQKQTYQEVIPSPITNSTGPEIFQEDANQKVWLGGEKGGHIYQFDPENRIFEKTIASPYGPDNYSQPFLDRDDNLWTLFSNQALCRWEPSNATFSEVIKNSDTLKLGFCYGATPDDLFIMGNLYSAQNPENRFYLFDKHTLKTSKIVFDTFQSFVTDLFWFENDEVLWTYNEVEPHGMFRFKYNRSGKFMLLDRFEELPTPFVPIGDDTEQLLLARYDTLFEVNTSTKEHKMLGVGLPGSLIWRIIHTTENQFLVITEKDIFIYDHQLNSFYYPAGLRNLSISNSVVYNECFSKTNAGTILFPAKSGFYCFHPDSIPYDHFSPNIVITNLKVDYENLTPDKNGAVSQLMPYTKNVSLKHYENDLVIEYTAIDLNDPNGIAYSYKLDNYNEDWVEAGEERITYYTNLSPGLYDFRVKARNAEGFWIGGDVVLSINILPPWYWSWWSKSLYLALSLLFAYLLYNNWRTKTQRNELEQQRQLNQRLQQVDRLKDQFLANTSHELRTPLQGIIGLSESLLEEESEPERRENIAMIISSGKRLNSLVNDILDFSKLKHLDIELLRRPINLRVLVDIVLHNNAPLVKGKTIELINSVPSNLPPIDGDENRIQQILYNLIGNAIKFTEKGSIIVHAIESEGMVKISVEDTGIGIPENKLEAIFQEFEQADGSISREFTGTGLGLSISKRLVELHDGHMWVTSKVGEGSTFFLTLPISKQLPTTLNPGATSIQSTVLENTIPNSRPVTSLASSRENTIRVLVVDDEVINQQVLQKHLSGQNFDITRAMNGEEAIRLIEEHPDFDLVLLDIMMPRMSGYEVCQKIREKYLPSELPIIMITAKNQLQDIVQGLSLGANDYLPKPFHKEELLARIKTQIDLHRIFDVAGRFVPNEFLRSLKRERITEVLLGDHTESEVTVLFTDIRDYTTLAETMTPEENFKFINAFHGRMGPIITAHGGFINQYLGDAIMAIFPNDAGAALQAAIDMQAKLAQYNQERQDQKRSIIKMGIGLHTGALIMGIIGDQNRLDAATIADTVNTASRIESLTKHFGTSILLSEETLQQIENTDRFHLRFLGKVQVKGKKEPVALYECFDRDGSSSTTKKAELQSEFEKGLRLFFAQEFPQAAATFDQILKVNPADQPARLFLSKSSEYSLKGVPEDWTGVEVMRFK